MSPRSPRLLALLWVLSSSSLLLGQTSSPEADRLRPPGLLARPDSDEAFTPLRLRSLAVDVVVTGFLATTTIDLTYHNEHHRDLEGRFFLPLPDGSVPSAFAMEVGGKLREGVVVSKDHGRVVVERIIRRNVDPGLLEWVQGNVFRARVYPIPAHGTKRLVVAYEQDLRESGNRFTYGLPLAYGSVKTARVRVAAVGGAALRRHDIAALETVLEEPQLLELAGEAVDLSGSLTVDVTIPSAAPQAFVARGADGETYFCARVPVAPMKTPVSAPERMTVLWDASASRRESDLDKEREVLAEYLARIRDVRVRLVAFSDDIWFRETYDVREGKADDLLTRLRRLEPDGGTRIGCLDSEIALHVADLVLLFSDGLETIPGALPGLESTPLFALTSADTHDTGLLRGMSRQGRCIDLRRVSVPEAVESLVAPPATFIGAGHDPEAIRDLEPRGPVPVGSHFVVCGRLAATEPTTLKLWFGSRDVVERTVEVTVDPDALTDRVAVDRLWAKARIETLSQHRRRHETEITELGKRFSIVTPYTSLIVLETLEDYVEHEIVPPPEWREQYATALAVKLETAEKVRVDRMTQLRERWRERRDWWEKEFEIPPKPTEKLLESVDESSLPVQINDIDAVFDFGADDGDSGVRDHPGSVAYSVEEPDDEGSVAPRIEVLPWDPKTPYLEALRESGEDAYERYLALKSGYGTTPSFFLDAADFFLKTLGNRRLALRALSNVAELELGSERLLRVLAHRYEQLGELELAAAIFEDVLRLRPEEPQSHRDLGLVLARLGRYREAIRHLEAVCIGEWSGRFPGIESIALGELGRVVAECARKTGRRFHTLPDELVQPLDVDLRIICTWDADLCDIDLWIDEPHGESAGYSHQRTAIGGFFADDYVSGYGPEEYFIRRAMDGKYRVRIHYFGDSQQTIAGPTTVQILMIENYGRENETRVSVTRRLEDVREKLQVAEIELP